MIVGFVFLNSRYSWDMSTSILTHLERTWPRGVAGQIVVEAVLPFPSRCLSRNPALGTEGSAYSSITLYTVLGSSTTDRAAASHEHGRAPWRISSKKRRRKIQLKSLVGIWYDQLELSWRWDQCAVIGRQLLGRPAANLQLSRHQFWFYLSSILTTLATHLKSLYGSWP